VNVGVLIRQVHDVTHPEVRLGASIDESWCTLRRRLGSFETRPRDVWWPLVGDPIDVAAEIRPLILHGALPWLAAFGDLRSAAQELRSDAAQCTQTPSPVVRAIVAHSLGDEREARQLLTRYIDSPLPDAHRAHVVEIANRLGVSGLS
jgi:hypothetical protein